jgi:iron complex outermembrane receptor protein
VDNKLWLVGGVRFEETKDDGLGPINDIRATYERDANGELRRDAAGRLIPITTDPLAAAQLRYQERGAEARRSYSGYYPSINASYSFSDGFVARAAFARTIGRPPLTQIIPGITVTDPDSPATTRTITVVNTGLRPWTSNNYDLSLEVYNVKGAVISASVFRKDIRDFFGASRIPATVELLEEFGLSEDYLDYEVVTRQNFGEASITGLEVSWRQALYFLPDWARGFQVFVNATRLRRSGANAVDFSSFSPLNVNGGVSVLRKKLSLKLNVAYAGEIKGNRIAPSAAVPADTFQNVAPKTTVDVYGEYRLFKRISLYASVSNLTGQPKRTYRYAPDTPDYAKPFRYQDYGTLVTFGAKLDF